MTVEKFWERVDKTGDCWLWTMSKDNHGYGMARVGKLRLMKAHQASWLLSGKPQWSPGEILHHICKTPACVKPEHLMITTRRDHEDAIGGINSSKTHCSKGHPYNDSNTYRWPKGGTERKCKVCMKSRSENRTRLKRASKDGRVE